MALARVLADAVGSVLKPEGFKRKADTWWQETADCILLVNCQKSMYSRKYYINVAVWLKAVSPAAGVPRENHCHVRLRWNRLMPAETNGDRYLDLEDESISDEDRISAIADLLQKFVLPFLRSVRTLDGVREAYQTGTCGSFVVVDAQRVLKEPRPLIDPPKGQG